VPTNWKGLTASIPWPKWLRPRNAVLLLVIILIVGLIITLWRDAIIELFQSPDPSASRILVLDDCDPDFRNSPFDDRVVSFSPRGQTTPKLTGLNICETVGGARMLATSPDGEFFLVCENVSHHLIACRTQTGARLWTLDGQFSAATVAPDGTTYALISTGTIYGSRTVIIDRQGQITKDAKVGGTDIAIDSERNVLWLVGATIKKCDLDLNVLRELPPLPWCAVSVDVNPDGSVWAAERQHPNIAQSSNRLLRISASGMWIEKAVALDFSPLCLRVDRSDGSLGSRAAHREPRSLLVSWSRSRKLPAACPPEKNCAISSPVRTARPARANTMPKESSSLKSITAATPSTSIPSTARSG